MPHPFSFTVRSRYSQPRRITLLDEEQGTFLVKGESRYFRRSEEMYDFTGGPCLFIDDDFYGLGRIRGLVSPKDEAHREEGHASVIVSVELSAEGRDKIRNHKERSHAEPTEEMGSPTAERSGGQGIPDRPSRGGGDLPLGEGRGSGDEVAERLPQEDRVEDQLPPRQVEGVGGSADSRRQSRERVRLLATELRRTNEERRREIEALFPRAFRTCGPGPVDSDQSDGPVRWAFGYGWDRLVESLAAAIEAEIERDPSIVEGDDPFCILQMKEKFACLRVYAQGKQTDRIRAFIEMTEDLSSATCEVCGDVGHLCRSEDGKGGWLKTFCPDCCLLAGYSPVPEEDK